MHGAAAMPAEPAAVAAYLAHRAEGGARMGTLRMATAAIAAAHRREGEVNPCADRAVRVVHGRPRPPGLPAPGTQCARCAA